MRILLLLSAFLGLALLAPVLPAWSQPADDGPPKGTTPSEAKLGKQVSEQIEKQFKVVKDDVAVARLEAIANAIAPLTQRPDVKYTCKIIDTPALNAMSIPGGTIYFTKGLMDAVESDCELAGVTAHEIAHNSLFHQKRMAEREAKARLGQLAALILTSVYSKGADVDTGALLTMSELFVQSLLNGYSVDLEKEADCNALHYLYDGKKYDPVGLYSVILGFRMIERTHPPVDWGYLKTHPDPDERVRYIVTEMKKLGITPNLWRAIDFSAKTAPVDGGKDGYRLTLGKVDIFTFTQPEGDHDAKARAEAAASALNRRFNRDYISQVDIVPSVYNGEAQICLPSVPVFTLMQQDAETLGVSLESLANRVKAAMQNAIMTEKTKRQWP